MLNLNKKNIVQTREVKNIYVQKKTSLLAKKLLLVSQPIWNLVLLSLKSYNEEFHQEENQPHDQKTQKCDCKLKYLIQVSIDECTLCNIPLSNVRVIT